MTHTRTYTHVYLLSILPQSVAPSPSLNRLRKPWHTHIYTCTTCRPHVYWHKTMRKKLCKMLVDVVFGRISTLVSLATRSPKLIKLTKKTNRRRKRKRKRGADVCRQNARNQVRYTVSMMQRISIFRRSVSLHLHISRLLVDTNWSEHVVISNIWILEHLISTIASMNSLLLDKQHP